MSPPLTLGLDLGTFCGWALLGPDGARVDSGAWECHTRIIARRGLRGGPVQRLLLLQAYLDEVARDGRVTVCAYEEVRRHTGTTASHVWGALEAVVLLAAHRHGWTVAQVGVGQAKRRLTGHGGSGKWSMVRAAMARWDMRDCGEDEADALAVALTAVQS